MIEMESASSYYEGLSDTSTPTTNGLYKLYLALIQCIGMIAAGYLTGRMGIIKHWEATGLNTFIGKFSLPSLIFITLCKIDFSIINWAFILSILTAKSILFVLVIITIGCLNFPKNLDRAGLFAIFCTQSNDFAIGVPIFEALYPNYVNYLYLMAPINLLILNPIGFVLMEYGKMRTIGDETRSNVLFGVLVNAIKNPITFMTALGIMCNYVFKHSPPAEIDILLTTFGNAFLPTALFSMGMRMVGKLKSLTGTGFMLPGILIVFKLILAPLLMRESVGLYLSFEDADKGDISDYSTLAFLYGILPSAPGVYVFATAYALEIDMIAVSLALCTLVSAPLIYTSAKMIGASEISPNEYQKSINSYDFDISVISIVAGICVLAVFVIKRRLKFPYVVASVLILTEIFGCCVTILRQIGLNDKIGSILNCILDFGAVIWTSFLATLLFRNPAVKIPNLKKITFGLTGMIVMVIAGYAMSSVNYHDSTTHPEPWTSLFSVLIVLFSFSITIVSLYKVEQSRNAALKYLSENDNENILIRSTSRLVDHDLPNLIDDDSLLLNNHDDCETHSNVCNVCTKHGDVNQCTFYCRDELDTIRHAIFLFSQCCAMFLWIVVMILPFLSGDEPVAVFRELQYMMITFRRGQCVVAFVVYVCDMEIIAPIATKIRNLYFGPSVILPEWEALPFDTRALCDDFCANHFSKCRYDVEKTAWNYGKYFYGSDLVDWLISNEIVATAAEAERFGNNLLLGRIIHHYRHTEYFVNQSSKPYIYAFTEETALN